MSIKTPTEPLFMADAVVTLGEDDYAAAVSSVAITPTAGTTSEFRGLKPGAVWRRTAAATWALDLTFVQDTEDRESLLNYLYDHEGEIVPARIEPNTGGQAWTADINVVPGVIGGAIETWATSTVSLPLQGRPERVDAPETVEASAGE